MTESFVTKDDRNLFVWLGERIGHILLRKDDDRAIKSRSKPRDMCMPPKSPPLSYHCEVVDIALPGLNRTLGYICRPIRPTTPKLPDSVPVISLSA